nr:sulfatase-like hydrolase/transferase [Sphingomonas populi]
MLAPTSPRRLRIFCRSLLMGAAALLNVAVPLPATARQTIAPPVPAAPSQRPPNIIMILADDFGVEGINAYGGEYFTPNVDRLAREGMRFENAHAMPLCSPSRVRLMTGLDNRHNYQAFGYLAPGQRTFANVLHNAGYATGMVGKWQLMGNGFDGRVGITPEQAGFDDYSLWQLKALDAKGSRYWGPTRVSPNMTTISEEGFGPDRDVDYAIDFIHKNKDRPFFLYYSMVLVHSPFVPTPDSMTAQGPKARFAGMVSYMDKEVGAVMEALHKDGLDKNTVVIFTGDNGTNRQITTTRNGYSIHGGKGSPTINGTHVPMVAWAPGRIPADTVSQALVGFEDILPTFAEIAGAPLDPKSTDGVSQLPVMLGQRTTGRDWIFEHYSPAWLFEPARFVFDAHWKLYGDGKFVSMNPLSGVETEVKGVTLKAEAARRKKQFQNVLASIHDGALDPTRFPWCAGHPSIKPAQSSIIAGCDYHPGGNE